jgi:hypothetical protein
MREGRRSVEVGKRRSLKLREGAYEGHRKAMETQKANKRTAYPMMWRKMRLASQNRVREEEDFEEVSGTHQKNSFDLHFQVTRNSLFS